MSGQAESKIAELLHEMAKVLSVKIDQIRILRGAYALKGWQDEEVRTEAGREQLQKVLRGEVPIAVVVLTPPQSSERSGAAGDFSSTQKP